MFTNHMKRRIRHLIALAEAGNIRGDMVKVKNGCSIKYDYLTTGRSVLRAIAKELGLEEFEIRINPGGPAVAGDVYLYGMWPNPSGNPTGNGINIQFGEPHMVQVRGQASFVHRRITALDGRIGTNRWSVFEDLRDPDAFVIQLRQEYCRHDRLKNTWAWRKSQPEHLKKLRFLHKVVCCSECGRILGGSEDIPTKALVLVTDPEFDALAAEYLTPLTQYHPDSGLGGVFTAQYRHQTDDGRFFFRYTDWYSSTMETYRDGFAHTGRFVIEHMLVNDPVSVEKLGIDK